jgi:hypothetical protein
MSNICRVDTDSLESAASDIDKEKTALDKARTDVTGTTLPTGAFGRVDQSGPAAQAHAAKAKAVAKELEAAAAEATKLMAYLRAWKTKYETDTNRAVECLINLRNLKPATPGQH